MRAAHAHTHPYRHTDAQPTTNLNPPGAPPACCLPAAQSPYAWVLSPLRRYTFCIWIRLGAGSAVPNMSTRINMVYPQNNQVIMTSGNILVIPAWQRFCLANYQPLIDTSMYISIGMGFGSAVWHFDDVSFTHADAGPPPEGNFAPGKIDAPISAFEVRPAPPRLRRSPRRATHPRAHTAPPLPSAHALVLACCGR